LAKKKRKCPQCSSNKITVRCLVHDGDFVLSSWLACDRCGWDQRKPQAHETTAAPTPEPTQ